MRAGERAQSVGTCHANTRTHTEKLCMVSMVGKAKNPKGEFTTTSSLNQYNSELHSKYLYPQIKHSSHPSPNKLVLQ